MSRTITIAAVTAIAATAIARANGHPAPEIFGEIVASNLPGDVAGIELSMSEADAPAQQPAEGEHVEEQPAAPVEEQPAQSVESAEQPSQPVVASTPEAEPTGTVEPMADHAPGAEA